MGVDGRTAAQLGTIGWLHAVLGERDIDYWLFGGWAVDFHAGRVTREHEDVDVAVWQTDLVQLTAILRAHGWVHTPESDGDGYTGFEREDVRVELAFLARDETGSVFTPVAQGRGYWPSGAFGDVEAQVNGVHARVIDLVSLIEEKTGPREDAAAAAKDRADVALLRSLSTGV